MASGGERETTNGRGNGAPANGVQSWRRSFYIGIGWAIVALGVALGPLPGPLGVPLMLLGAIILLRNSNDFRRFFVKLKRRYPMMTWPVRTALGRLRARIRLRRQARAAARAAAKARAITARAPSSRLKPRPVST